MSMVATGVMVGWWQFMVGKRVRDLAVGELFRVQRKTVGKVFRYAGPFFGVGTYYGPQGTFYENISMDALVYVNDENC